MIHGNTEGNLKMEVVQYILGLGPAVVIPIIMFIFAMIFGAKPGDAAKNAMTVGIGFLGLSLLIGFMVTSLVFWEISLPRWATWVLSFLI